jgi:hypothetical protein
MQHFAGFVYQEAKRCGCSVTRGSLRAIEIRLEPVSQHVRSVLAVSEAGPLAMIDWRSGAGLAICSAVGNPHPISGTRRGGWKCAEQGVVVEQIPWSEGKRPVTRAMMGFLARSARRLS